MRLSRIAVVALVVVGTASTAFGFSDMLTELSTALPGKVPFELTLSMKLRMHGDTFAVTDLLTKNGGADLWTPADGFGTWDAPAPVLRTYTDGAAPGEAYITLADGRNEPALDALNAAAGLNTCSGRIVNFGAGNDAGALSTWSYAANEGGPDTGLPVGTNSKIALGNIATATEALLDGGDTEVSGYALAFDTLTGTMIPDVSTPNPNDVIPNPADYFLCPAKKFVDSDDDVQIEFDTIYDFNVVEGGGLYYDRNRDGEVHDVRLDMDETDADKSDRAYFVVYETDDGTFAPLNNPSGLDCDGDGREVDDYWLGNPFAPVDADNPATCRGADGGVGRESCPDITSVGTLGELLIVAEALNFRARNTVDMTPPPGQGQQLFIKHVGEYDLVVTDGRLYDYYVANSPYPEDYFSINGIMNASFTYGLGNPDLTRYMEWTDDGTVHIYSVPIPEPTGAVLLLGSVVGMIVRRKRK
jgi:hypothetical protein